MDSFEEGRKLKWQKHCDCIIPSIMKALVWIDSVYNNDTFSTQKFREKEIKISIIKMSLSKKDIRKNYLKD